MREKVSKPSHIEEVIYTEKRWKVLKDKRKKAKKILHILGDAEVQSYLYGSVARGDVNKKSDIDIVVIDTVPSYFLEILLEKYRPFLKKEIVQATPNSAIKGHIYIDDITCITFPLHNFKRRDIDFYKFGGILSIDDIEKRVCGVSKKLLLIEPTDKGHIESSIIGREVEVAKKIDVSIDVVYERVRVLTRRDAIGRTGTFLKIEMDEEESFEKKLKMLLDRNPEIRRSIIKG